MHDKIEIQLLNIIHEDLGLTDYFHKRHYDIEEVAELANMDKKELQEALNTAILPKDVLEKFELVFREPIEQILGSPELRLN